MSQIEELIEKLCPNGVEWKPLGEVMSRSTKRVKDRKVPVYCVSNTKGLILSDSLHDFSVYSDDISNYLFTEKDMFVYNPSRLNIGSIACMKENAGAVSPMYVVFSVNKELVSVNYAFYFLKSHSVNFQINSMIEEGARFRFTFEKWNKIQIPLPPLAIQTRIVEILDHFTNLTANLTAELNLRRKQFEHYLDAFFGENEETMESMVKEKNIEIKALQDLGTLTRGRRFVRDDIRTEGVPCIHYGDMYTTYGIAEQNTITFLDEEKANKLRFAEPNDIVIVGAGENDWDIGVGLAWFGKQKVVVHDACYIYKHNMNPKFVSYYLRSNNYHLQIRKWVSSGKISSISDKNLGKAKIPFYSANEQQSIVATLDKFTALIENIEKELALRQKQYEYYREQLLNF